MSQMSNSECSSLEEQMRGRLPSCRGSATQQRVRRSTGLVRQVLAVGYVLIALIPNGGFNLMVYPGQTRPHYRGWIRIFFSGIADHEDPRRQRGHHNIEDELIFTNHKGYVFHDSRGFEAGSEDELKIVQEFVTRKSRERRLKNRLHAIWLVLQHVYSTGYRMFLLRYCIPMDNNRPSLDLKHFQDICPDNNGMSWLT